MLGSGDSGPPVLMVVQPRSRVFRCFAQHDHGRASGVAAAAWCGAAGDRPLRYEAVLAIGLHDLGWREQDERPTLDPDRGRPYDFMSTPIARRLRIYRDGIDAVQRLDPYAGLLASLHFSAFVADGSAPAFVDAERERQEALRTALRVPDAEVRHDFEVLRALDLLSLVACLSGPGSDPSEHPRWVTLPMRVAGVEHALSWRSEEQLTVARFPFDRELRFALPYRDVPRRTYATQAALLAAWEAAVPGVLELRVTPHGAPRE